MHLRGFMLFINKNFRKSFNQRNKLLKKIVFVNCVIYKILTILNSPFSMNLKYKKINFKTMFLNNSLKWIISNLSLVNLKIYSKE